MRWSRIGRGGVGPGTGQAQIELIVAIPVLVVAGLIAAQLLSFGYAQTLADGAAEAAAIAAADGRDPDAAAREALPDWAEGRIDLDDDGGGGLHLELAVPSVLPGLAGRLHADAEAWVRPAGGPPAADARGAG